MSEQIESYSMGTISGAELQCKFAFPKIYFSKDPADVNQRIFYDVGFLANIGWKIDNSTNVKYALNSVSPLEITQGSSIAQGQMIFKIFHHDSFEHLKAEILKGIDEGTKKIEMPKLEESPFVTLVPGVKVEEITSKNEEIEWARMPLFDIILLSNTSEELLKKQVRKKEIKGVKVITQGFSESIASLEANSMVSFIAIGNITDWELVSDE